MGTEIKCKECRKVLFEFYAVPTDVIWYSWLRNNLNGKCPNCGHKLPNPSKYTKKMQFKVKSIIPIAAK